MSEAAYSKRNGALDGAFIWKRVSVTTSTTSGQILSVQNPEGFLPNAIQGAGAGSSDTQDGLGWLDQYRTPGEVMAKEAIILIRRQSTAACTLDVGIGASASGDYTQFFSGKSVAVTPPNTIYNTVLDGATQGNRVYMGPAAFFNVTVASGNANGLVADFFLLADSVNSVQTP